MKIQDNRQRAGRLRSMTVFLQRLSGNVRRLETDIDNGTKSGLRGAAGNVVADARCVLDLAHELEIYAIRPNGVDLTPHARLVQPDEQWRHIVDYPVPSGGIRLYIDRSPLRAFHQVRQVCEMCGAVVQFEGRRYIIDSYVGTHDDGGSDYVSILGLAPIGGESKP